MSEIKVGDKAWTAAVWTKTAHRKKVHTLISEVTVDKVFEDGTYLVSDTENIGMYVDVKDLLDSPERAVAVSMNGLKKWLEEELNKEKQR